MKEFDVEKRKRLIATLIFSVTPIFAYYFVDGRYTSFVNLFFGLVAWIFLKRYLDVGKVKNIIASSSFLALSLLAHHTTAISLFIVLFGWAIFYSFLIMFS